MTRARPWYVVLLLLAELSGTTATETARDCSDTEVLKESVGIPLGTCVPASSYNTVQNVVVDPDDGPPYVAERKGGPGYVIVDHILEVCELGYYCPFNTETNLYDQKIKCGKGEFCYQGCISPLECSGLLNCPDGCTIVAGFAGSIIFAIIALLLLGLCIVMKVREASILKRSNLAHDEFLDDSLEVFGKKFKFDIKPVSIEFENMGMRLKVAKPGTPPLLQNINGHFPPGSLIALMGPSGCGKTTFMNAIVDRAPYGIVSGTVKVNGVINGINKANNVVGFVPQDDIVFGNLTVFQNLYYHAKLRLPQGTKNKDILEHVEHCIIVLGLSKIQNSMVGTPEKRGISGGQKKRVNIGLELASMPSIMFMDEPTSGLDGAATVNLARCLGLLKTTGLTIMCVIHQPRWLVFKEFEHLLLLGEGGQQVYSGRSQYIVPYLEGIGFKCPEHENPADWMIDVCSNLEKRYDEQGNVDKNYECPQDLYKEWASKYAADAVKPTSKWHQGDAEIPPIEPLVKRQTLGCCMSFGLVASRVFRQTNMHNEINDICVMTFLALFSAIGGLIALTQGCNGFAWTELVNRFNPSFLFPIFIGMQHRFDYGEEKLMLRREVNSGIYFTSLWLGKTVKSCVFGTLKFSMFALVMYIFMTPVQTFWTYLVAWIFLGLWWVAFAQFISLFCASQITAVMLLLLTPIFEPIFSGNLCQMFIGTGLESGFCPRGSMNGFGFFPGHEFMKMMWVAEIDEFPSYVADFKSVNTTTYWYNIPSDERTSSGSTSSNETYSVSTYEATGGLGPWGFAFATLLRYNIQLRLYSLVCIAFMAASTNRWVSDKIARCSHRMHSVFGICHRREYMAPEEELAPPMRRQESK